VEHLLKQGEQQKNIAARIANSLPILKGTE